MEDNMHSIQIKLAYGGVTHQPPKLSGWTHKSTFLAHTILTLGPATAGPLSSKRSPCASMLCLHLPLLAFKVGIILCGPSSRPWRHFILILLLGPIQSRYWVIDPIGNYIVFPSHGNCCWFKNHFRSHMKSWIFILFFSRFRFLWQQNDLQSLGRIFIHLLQWIPCTSDHRECLFSDFEKYFFCFFIHHAFQLNEVIVHWRARPNLIFPPNGNISQGSTISSSNTGSPRLSYVEVFHLSKLLPDCYGRGRENRRVYIHTYNHIHSHALISERSLCTVHHGLLKLVTCLLPNCKVGWEV